MSWKVKHVYVYSLNVRTKEGEFNHLELRIISANYESANYKLVKWLRENNLQLITHSFLKEFNVLE